MINIESIKPVEGLDKLPVLGYDLRVYEVDSATGDIPKYGDDKPVTMYILCLEKDGELRRILANPSDIGELFKFNEESTNVITKFINDMISSGRLGLSMLDQDINVVGTSNHPISLVFVNTIELTMIEQYPESDKQTTINNLIALGDTSISGMVSQAESHYGIVSLVGMVIQTAQKIFNKVHFTDKLDELADIIRGCSFMDDNGNEQSLTLTAVDNMLKQVKDKLFVR